MKQTLLFIALTVAWQSAWAFRCGRFVVNEGEGKMEVLQKCGEPD